MAYATEYAEHRNRLRRPSFDWCKEPTEAFLALTYSSASTKPVIRIPKKDVRRGVRRGDRGQRPTATKDPNTKPLRRRRRRHCSRVRWPRFPQLAPRPHPSRQWLRIRFFAAGPIPKRRSERRSARRPGSATHGYRRTVAHAPLPSGHRYETTTQVS